MVRSSSLMLSHAVGVFPAATMAAAAATAATRSKPQTQSYKNITLQSPIMSARVYMPLVRGGHPSAENDAYYVGSRFEHGSMIGDVVLGGDREVYGRGLWRTPHDPGWPESGVGLASEFGCGDDGASCAGKGEITNGVLGYEAARDGEPFLKIGVGALIKGSCPDCGGADGGYKFNSPYEFYRPPSWRVMPSPGPNEITFLSEETLGDFGYSIQKTVRLDGNILTVRSLLTNLGKKQFTTPWYSHHFFTGDDVPVGPGYVLDLGLSEYGLREPTPQYKQPGLGSWSRDFNEYANLTMAQDGSISLAFKKVVPEGVRLKAEFLDENTQTLTDGSFTLRAPNGVSVHEKVPELQTQSRNPFIYGYNVYAERGTVSPEPMLLLYLQPKETTFWTQHLRFSSTDTNGAAAMFPFMSMFNFEALGGSFGVAFLSTLFIFLGVFLGLVITSYIRFALSSSRIRRRVEYSSIPDHQPSKQEEDAGDTGSETSVSVV